MIRKAKEWVVVVVGVIISICIPLIFTVNVKVIELTDSLVISLLVVIIALILQYLHHSYSISELISDFLIVDKDLKQYPELYSRLKSIVSGYGQIMCNESPLSKKRLEKLIKEHEISIRELADGRIIVEPDEEIPIAIYLWNLSKKVVKCTSYVNPKEWWQTEGGKRYLKANKQARERGVEIIRVFIISRERHDEWEAIKHLIREQNGIGIDVRVVDINDVPVRVLKDFAIYDDKIVGSGELTREGARARAYFIINETEVASYLRDFKTLLNRSKTFDAFDQEIHGASSEIS